MKKSNTNVAIIVVLFLLIAIPLSGCGGAPQSAEQVSQVALSTQTASQQQQQGPTEPPVKPLVLPVKFQVDKLTPRFMAEALEKQKPIIVFIYKENDPMSETVKLSLKSALESFDSSKYIILALNSEKPEHISGLVESLGVTYVPFIAIIDGTGTIIKEYAGYVDELTLKQAVFNAVGGTLQTETTAATEANEAETDR